MAQLAAAHQQPVVTEAEQEVIRKMLVEGWGERTAMKFEPQDLINLFLQRYREKSDLEAATRQSLCTILPLALVDRLKPDSGGFHEALQGGGNEGLCNQPWSTKRQKTISDTWHLLKRSGFILIKGPPQSGKTSYLQLIGQHVRAVEPDCHVIYVTLARLSDTVTFEQLVEEASKRPFEQWSRGPQPVVFLVDDGQRGYAMAPDSALWGACKTVMAGPMGGLSHMRFVVAAAYGVPRSVASAGPLMMTPVSPDASMTITVHPHSAEQPLSVAFSLEEFEELWQEYVSHNNLHYSYDLVKLLIFQISGGQPGIVVHCLQRTLSASHGTKRAMDNFAWNQLHGVQFYHSFESVRSVLPYKSLEVAQLEVLKLLLSSQQYTGRLSAADMVQACVHIVEPTAQQAQLEALEDAAKQLYRMGQLLISQDGSYTWTSYLHLAYFMANHYQRRKRVSQEFNTLDALISRALQCMDSKALANNLGKGKDGRPYERAFQMEFYRAVYGLCPTDEQCSPDVGPVFRANGFVDFYLTKKKWAIELLRDGDDSHVDEHMLQFLPGGAYHCMMESGQITAYAVIDLRGPSMQGKPVRRLANLTTVTFSDEFKRATIVSADATEHVCIGG